MSRDQTIKEGYLQKRGKINTDWKQRLFILNGKQLAYFKGSVSDKEESVDVEMTVTIAVTKECTLSCCLWMAFTMRL